MNTHTSKPEILGIDIGNTILDSNASPRTPFPDALRVIKRLTETRFEPSRIYVVSKVNEEQKIRAMNWLSRSGFHKITGIPEDHVEFCQERHEKGPICDRLGVTHFIDDRPEVLANMPHVSHRFLFGGVEEDVERFKAQLTGVTRVWTWKEIEALLLM